MLVLTRKVNQTIRLGDDIKITIVGVDCDAIRIGIEAPRSLAVHREEVYQEIVSEKLGSAATGPRATPQRPIVATPKRAAG